MNMFYEVVNAIGNGFNKVFNWADGLFNGAQVSLGHELLAILVIALIVLVPVSIKYIKYNREMDKQMLEIMARVEATIFSKTEEEKEYEALTKAEQARQRRAAGKSFEYHVA